MKRKRDFAISNATLTNRADGAIRLNMRRRVRNWGIAIIAGSALTGCVQVTAPDKPIVINLNINIRQEVVYRLNNDAQNLIDEESDIF